jgi:hypothetical protein
MVGADRCNDSLGVSVIAICRLCARYICRCLRGLERLSIRHHQLQAACMTATCLHVDLAAICGQEDRGREGKHRGRPVVTIISCAALSTASPTSPCWNCLPALAVQTYSCYGVLSTCRGPVKDATPFQPNCRCDYNFHCMLDFSMVASLPGRHRFLVSGSCRGRP